MYGADCDEQCGHCREEEQCRHTNGACLVGCTAGYQGEICKLRKYLISFIYVAKHLENNRLNNIWLNKLRSFTTKGMAISLVFFFIKSVYAMFF